MIISINTKKRFENPTLIHDFKKLSKLGIEENLLNIIKSIYEKSTANIIVTAKRLNAFPLNPGKR